MEFLLSPAMLGATTLCGIGVLHSVLGEVGILRPLFAAEWRTDAIPRFALERILRFAWHLTTLAWVALAAVLVGAPVAVTFALCAFASGGLIFAVLRGHLAWPLFALAGIAALASANLLPTSATRALCTVAASTSFVLAAVHVFWAAGGRTGWQAALPHDDSAQPLYRPGPGVTLVVAAALATWGALLLLVPSHVGPDALRWLVALGAAVFAVRAVGDGKYVGFSKQFRGSRFAVLDDNLYTPIVVVMSFAGAGAFILG